MSGIFSKLFRLPWRSFESGRFHLPSADTCLMEGRCYVIWKLGLFLVWHKSFLFFCQSHVFFGCLWNCQLWRLGSWWIDCGRFLEEASGWWLICYLIYQNEACGVKKETKNIDIWKYLFYMILYHLGSVSWCQNYDLTKNSAYCAVRNIGIVYMSLLFRLPILAIHESMTHE